jgi:purine-binding chemotaxis protein CheW
MVEAQLLAEARRRAGISQRELARRAGTSQAAVARIERARQSPSAATLRRLVAACGVDLELGLPDDEAPVRGTFDGRLLRCTIGGGSYAFPAAAVTEVVPYVAPTRLPGQPPDAGVALVRGKVLPTVDAALRLGVATEDPPRRMVIVATRDGTHAVIVAAARDIIAVDPERVAPPPRGSGASAHVAAIAAIDAELVIVVDPEALCAG